MVRAFSGKQWEVVQMTRAPRPQTRDIPLRLGEPVPSHLLAGADALVHCAYDLKAVRRNAIWESNVEGSAKLFAAAREAGIPKLVLISTISAFPGCKSLYGQAKLEMERIAREYGALIVRPGLIYGDTSGGMFERLRAQVENSKIIPLIGDGSQIQYLVHEQDLCAFVFRYCDGQIPLPPSPVTVAHEQGWTFRQILESLAAAKGKNPRFIPLPWRLMWAGFRLGEILHLPMPFRSDSIVSLMNQNPKPDFSQNRALCLPCRPFGT